MIRNLSSVVARANRVGSIRKFSNENVADGRGSKGPLERVMKFGVFKTFATGVIGYASYEYYEYNKFYPVIVGRMDEELRAVRHSIETVAKLRLEAINRRTGEGHKG